MRRIDIFFISALFALFNIAARSSGDISLVMFGTVSLFDLGIFL